MVLFKIDTQCLAVLPRERYAPGAIDMDTVSHRGPVKAMEVEARNIDLVQYFSLLKNLQPTQTTPPQGRLNMAAGTTFE